jgi:hypothetical protein
MAAARAARADAPKPGAEAPAAETATGEPLPAAESDVPAEDEWAFLPKTKVAQATSPPSVFFSLLTSHKQAAVPDPPSLANMHIAVRGDLAAAEQRVREAFGPGVESPDDIVLRARQGRGGTGGEGETKEAKAAVRAAMVEQPAPEPVSEAAAATAKPKEEDAPSLEPVAKGTKPATKHSKPRPKAPKAPAASGNGSQPKAGPKPKADAKPKPRVPSPTKSNQSSEPGKGRKPPPKSPTKPSRNKAKAADGQ